MVPNVESLTPKELKRELDLGEPLVLLDVREPEELAIARIAGAIAIPLGELGARWGELDPARPIVCICHHGIRSAHAARALEEAGFRRVINLAGGIDRWSCDVDPRVPRYR
jgi:rhodanese-related sulfurtransferase